MMKSLSALALFAASFSSKNPSEGVDSTLDGSTTDVALDSPKKRTRNPHFRFYVVVQVVCLVLS